MKTVDVDFYYKYMVWHEERSADPAYRSLTADQRGVLATLENLAAKTNWDGHFSARGDRKGHLTYDEVAEYLAFDIPRLTKARAKKELDVLMAKGLIKKTKGRKAMLPYWKRWQAGVGNAATARKQKSRASKRRLLIEAAVELIRDQHRNGVPRQYCLHLISEFIPDVGNKKAENLFCEMVDGRWIRVDANDLVFIVQNAPAAPPSPPSVSGLDSGCDTITHARDMSHTEKEKNERDTSVSQNSVSEGAPPRACAPAGTKAPSDWGGRGRGDRHNQPFLDDPYGLIYNSDPVDAAVRITGDDKPLARNSWLKRIREWPGGAIEGERVFKTCLEDLVIEIKDGNPKALNNRARYFNGILRKRENDAA